MRSDSIPNLDLLRALAVLYVFGFHVLLVLGLVRSDGPLHQLGQLGHWGVLMFFVHTSMVLTFSLERTKPARYSYLTFLARRCFRIYPLAILLVAVITLYRLPVGNLVAGNFVPASFDGRTIASNLLLVQNLTDVGSLAAPLWSLPYELQMYLVLPALFGVVEYYSKVPLLLAFWVGAAGLSLACIELPFGELFTYVPCFLAGVIGYARFRTRPGNPRLPFALLPVFLLLVTGWFLYFPRLKSGWLCCLAIGAALPAFEQMADGSFRRACELIARYSYGIYLTHWLALWLAFAYFGDHAKAFQWAVLAVTAGVLPVALYHTVEAPMIALGRRVLRASPIRASQA